MRTVRFVTRKLVLTTVTIGTLILGGCTGGSALAGQHSSPAPPSQTAEAAFARIDAGHLPDVRTTTLSDTDIRTEVPVVPNALALNLASRIVRNQALRARVKDGGSLEVTWQPIGSSADLLGVQLAVKHGESQVPITLWFDETAGFVATGGVLIDPAQWDSFSHAVIGALGEQAPDADPSKATESLTKPAAPQGTGPAIGFNTDGDLVVGFAGGALGSGDPVFVKIPKDAADGFLSEFGRAARGAATHPSSYRAGVETPTKQPATAAVGSRPDIDVIGDCKVAKCVAITFDDGPAPRTPEVTAALAKAGAGGTFFMLGNMVEADPTGVKAVALTGNEVASHTWRHNPLTRSDNGPALNQVKRNNDEIEKIIGERPLMMRPPYGDHNKRIDKIIGGQGQIVAQWDIDTLDWKTKSTSATITAAMSAQPGSIILMHDIHDFTVAAVPQIAEQLVAAGFKVVPMSELSSPNSWRAGTAYCAAPWIGRDCW